MLAVGLLAALGASDADIERLRAEQDAATTPEQRAALAAHYRQLSLQHPQSATLAYLYGRLLPDATAALRLFDQAAQLAPEFFWAHYGRGVTLIQLSAFNEAATVLQRAVQLRPDHAPARLSLAQALLFQQPAAPDEARAQLERARALDPNLAGLDTLAARLETGRIRQQRAARQHLGGILALVLVLLAINLVLRRHARKKLQALNEDDRGRHRRFTRNRRDG